MNYFLNITYITAFIPLLVFLFNAKNNRSKSIRVVLYYVIYSLLNEVFSPFLRGFIKNDSSVIEAINVASFTIFEYFFFAYFLYSSLHNANNKKALLIGSGVFVIAAVLNLYINFTSSSKIQTFDTLTVSVSAITLIIFSLIFLFEKIQKPDIGFIYAKKSFWIVVGIMIYFSGTFFLFLQYADLNEQEKENFWIINWFCIILKNIFFSIAFYLPEESKDTSDNNADLFFLQEPE